MPFLIGAAIGVVVGVPIGVFITSLMIAAKDKPAAPYYYPEKTR